MRIGYIVFKATSLTNQATRYLNKNNLNAAETSMAELRKFLNKQPELEAGGAHRTKEGKT